MSFTEIFKKSFLEGFNSLDISTSKIATTLLVTSAVALYIFFIYRMMTRKTFYSKSFNVAVAVISVITAGIILAMQSSLVISLGMVGALSIIRFRTAVKDPMDLVFMFWSISVGIVCGAGMYEISLLTSIIVTVALLSLDLIPIAKASMLLIVNSSNIKIEEELIPIIKRFSSFHKIKSRNITTSNIDMVVEVRAKDEKGLVQAIAELKQMNSVSLLSHDGEVTF